jgi:hypothetical protein
MDMNHDGMDMGSDMGSDMSSDMGSDMDSDMVHDGMDSDMDSDSNTSMNHSKSSWMFAFMPMLTIGSDYYKRVINLSNRNDGKIGFDDNSKGYLVVENKTIQAGGGLMIMAMPTSISWGGFVDSGLMAYKGGHVFRSRHVETRGDVKLSLRSMNTPQNLKDIANWSVSDRISYSSNGGVMFSGGFGATIFSELSTGYMAQGTWVTSVAKASSKHVLVSIKKSKMKMFMSTMGVTFAALELHKFNNADKNFNFLFDLSKPHGVKAYKDMLKGNIVTAQMMSESNIKVNGVKHVSHGNSRTQGRMTSRTLRIPVLYNNTNMAGKMSMQSYSENYMNNTQMEMEMGMYMRSHKTSGRLSNHKYTGFIFMAGSHQMTGEFTGASKSVLGSFKWYFQNEKGSVAYLKNRLKRAMNIMGMDKLKTIDLDRFKGQGPLRYVRGEIDLPLSDKFTKQIMALESNKALKTQMNKNVEISMGEFFANSEQLLQMCPKKQTQDRCKSKIVKKTKRAISKVKGVIVRMTSAFKLDDKKAFVMSYTRLGQLMLTNRFVFQEVFNMVCEKIPQAKFTLQGTRFSQSKVNL